jgi:LytS/YehU family sensor histidine kinase
VIDDYVAIIGVRFQDRLTVATRVGPGTEQGLVPHFMLQPLVENAVQHGIARRAGAGRIEISADRVGETLRLTVSDDGAGLDRGARDFPSEGIGLSNTRRRLRELYGDAHRLSLDAADRGGLCVTVEIPFRTVVA